MQHGRAAMTVQAGVFSFFLVLVLTQTRLFEISAALGVSFYEKHYPLIVVPSTHLLRLFSLHFLPVTRLRLFRFVGDEQAVSRKFKGRVTLTVIIRCFVAVVVHCFRVFSCVFLVFGSERRFRCLLDEWTRRAARGCVGVHRVCVVLCNSANSFV